MKRIIHTPSLSNKIATGLDMGITFAVEQVGMTLHLPFWHPVILGGVAGITWALFKWKDDITSAFVSTIEAFQLREGYAYKKPQHVVLFDKCRQKLVTKPVRRKYRGQPILLVDQDGAN
ncbi:MAG: hypothetical protein QXU82_00115 [Candidatus Aenigmatarchaeota archaeon]